MNSDTHYIKAGWMIDGSGAPVRKKVLLTVTKGIIAEIEHFSSDDHPDPELTTDLSRCTILPPLVDCHVHLASSGSTDQANRKQQFADGYDVRCSRIADHLHYLFSYGVLAVRDGGDRDGHVLRYIRKNADLDKRDPVIVKSPGHAWYQRGRYGAFIGRHPYKADTLQSAVNNKEIDSIDHIKIIHSGLNSLSEFAKETKPQFSAKDLSQIVALAKEKKKKVMVHANGSVPVRMALDAGCDSIEHGFFMGDENLKRMAEKQIAWVPTAVTMKAMLDNWDLLNDGRCKRDVIEKNLDHQLEQMSKARQYGVQVTLGTDAGCPGVIHGESVVEELRLFMKAGYSLVEAIQCASSRGAKLLGIDTLGSITKGKPAHFIVARATPSMLPRKLSYLEAIYLNGKPCDKAFFNKI